MPPTLQVHPALQTLIDTFVGRLQDGVLRGMKKSLCLLQLMLLFWTLSLAQGGKKQLSNTNKPNLSGQWVLDHQEDEFGKSNMRLPGEVKLIVVHNEPEIKITQISNSKGQSVSEELIYYSDGRGEKNLGPHSPHRISTKPSDADDEVMKSKTKWKGNKLVTQTHIHKTESGATLIMDIIDEWKLSTDGRTLILTTTYAGGNGLSPADLEAKLRPQLISPPSRPAEVKRVFRLTP